MERVIKKIDSRWLHFQHLHSSSLEWSSEPTQTRTRYQLFRTFRDHLPIPSFKRRIKLFQTINYISALALSLGCALNSAFKIPQSDRHFAKETDCYWWPQRRKKEDKKSINKTWIKSWMRKKEATFIIFFFYTQTRYLWNVSLEQVF